MTSTPSSPPTDLVPPGGQELDSGERQLLRRLLFYGFLVRVVVALALEFSGFSTRLAPDEETYGGAGWRTALYWMDEVSLPDWRMFSKQPLGYFYINAAFFYVFGHTEIPLKLVNALLGALTGRYVYLIARDLFGSSVATRSAQFAAFFPSLVLWSSVNIRDVWVIFLILFVSWHSLRIVKGGSLLALVHVGLGVYAITFFRDYLFFVVALPPVMAFLIGTRGNLGRNFFFAMLAAVGVLYLMERGAGAGAVPHMSLESLSQVRQDMAQGAGSAFQQNVDISTPGRALLFLPVGIVYFLFSPFPWQMTSLLKLFSLPEMLLMYYLTPSIVRGIVHTVRHHLREALQVLLLTALLTVSYALGEGNVGTLYRHRAQAILFYLMFASVGLDLKRAPRPVDEGLPALRLPA